MRTFFKTVGIVCIMIVLSTGSVQASAAKSGSIYVYSTISKKPVIEGSAECYNPKNSSDSHTESCTTTKLFTGKFSCSSEAKAFVAGCKVTAEVSYGQQYQTTNSHTWSIEPKTTFVCEWGYRQVKSEGYVYYYANDQIVSKSKVSGKYSYRRYYGGHYE